MGLNGLRKRLIVRGKPAREWFILLPLVSLRLARFKFRLLKF